MTVSLLKYNGVSHCGFIKQTPRTGIQRGPAQRQLGTCGSRSQEVGLQVHVVVVPVHTPDTCTSLVCALCRVIIPCLCVCFIYSVGIL